MKLHTGDFVIIISGKDRGKTGRVLRALEGKDRVVVAGINMRTRHVRKTPQRAGQRIRYEAALHVSNIMLIDPKTKKPTRTGYRKEGKTWERFAKRSGEILVTGRKLKKLLEQESKAKETKDTEDAAKEEAKSTEKKANPAASAKGKKKKSSASSSPSES